MKRERVGRKKEKNRGKSYTCRYVCKMLSAQRSSNKDKPSVCTRAFLVHPSLAGLKFSLPEGWGEMNHFQPRNLFSFFCPWENQNRARYSFDAGSDVSLVKCSFCFPFLSWKLRAESLPVRTENNCFSGRR